MVSSGRSSAEKVVLGFHVLDQIGHALVPATIIGVLGYFIPDSYLKTTEVSPTLRLYVSIFVAVVCVVIVIVVFARRARVALREAQARIDARKR